MDYNILKTELEDVAYSAMSDAEAATDLNIVDIPRIKARMTGSELMESQDTTEYIALSDAKKAQWLAVVGVGSDGVNPSGNIVEVIRDIWGNGSVTITSLGVNRNEIVSRATELTLGVVRESDVRTARAM